MSGERDPEAEQDHAEFTGWFEAQGYNSREHFDEDFMAEAFTAGMQAQRDLDDATLAAEVRAGHVHIETDEPQPAPELQAGEIVYLYHWRFDRGEEFGLYRHAADADARAAQHADEGLSEVLSMAVLGRPEQPAPELAALQAARAGLRKLAEDGNLEARDLLAGIAEATWRS
jgi:hypothetical protein